ncbi:MAG: alpha/beta fold hydrolase [Candidatus Binataceae bacterium]
MSYRREALVEDVRLLIAALGHDKAVLVGHDWGGFIAWETAIRSPALVRLHK